MMVHTASARLVLAVLAFAGVAWSAILPTSVHLQERMENLAGTSAGGDTPRTISYLEIESGRFQYIPPLRSTDERFRVNFYGDVPLHDGKPIFTFSKPESRHFVLNLHQAVKDFGGFHAHVANEVAGASVLRNEQGGVTLVVNNADLGKRLTVFNTILKKFGRNAALLATGWNAAALPAPKRSVKTLGRKPKQEAPDFADIHRSQPQNNANLHTLRDRLDRYRRVRLTDATGKFSLAVRAHPNGETEYQIFNHNLGAAITDFTEHLRV